MSPRSGWCTGPAGARPQHAHCRADQCGCDCHQAVGAKVRAEHAKTHEKEASR